MLAVLWVLFAIFTFNFFRDPDATVPPGKKLVLAPAHGTVDLIDETEEMEFMGGKCRRISIFLNVFDVHVQKDHHHQQGIRQFRRKHRNKNLACGSSRD